ncbi:acyltransferase [Chitinophaga pendula]|uniref:acyltransferase family protein n=1 Tax=Chitinophaga TaxID=79328 RepID=UPI000BB04F6E|nr:MULTISPECIES: acyltransferase [Chitinophaga]ASZ14191.1 hypothetical protein CK934_26185 [Chitinophaga sp. MD30]UCJ08173.1 acyltransferase [Chitinophaga pendula]
MAPSIKRPKHFYSLDIIRGVSALFIVIHHWQHFYFTGDRVMPVPFDRTQLPLYSVFALAYTNGFLLLDMFFLLSGFVFFWLYADRIAVGHTTGRSFFGYRFSRLYPVHVVTLLVVAWLQYRMLKSSGHYFIYQFNDTYHFLLNLFLVNSWGFERGPSFNGPIWSVSVEVLLYIVFFLLCRKRLHKTGILLGLVILGVFIQYFYSNLGQGFFSFFLGGIIYYVYLWVLRMKGSARVMRGIMLSVAVLWVLMLGEYYFSFLREGWGYLWAHMVPTQSPAFTDRLFDLGRNTFFRSIASPLTVLGFALWETIRGFKGGKYAFIGNYSYACYLLHFPLQIIFVLTIDALGVGRSVLHSPYALLLHLAIIVPISLAVYYYFELPVQQFFRHKLLGEGSRPIRLADPHVIAPKVGVPSEEQQQRI